MKSERALASRLRAWQSFRDIAHATSSLAASLAVRWSGHELHARLHLTRSRALASRFAADLDGGPRVLVAFGTDMGLCGRLNQSVAERVMEVVQIESPAACFLVGRRLIDALEGALPYIEEATPSSIEAVLDLADRVQSEVASLFDPASVRLGFVRIDSRRHETLADWGAADDESQCPSTGGPLLPPALAAPAMATDLLVHARIVHATCEALLGEARLRQATMRRAQDTAEKRIGEHERELRKARQERITQEMLEVLGGRRSAAR
jgi:F-type H+-transporting ATPase subunit gamma